MSGYGLLTDKSTLFQKTKLKALADDKINATETLKLVLGRIENVLGKGENAGYQHFLLFPKCFQKAFFLRVVKSPHYHMMPCARACMRACVCVYIKNIVRKGEIACNKQFLLFSKCFLPYMALIFHSKCTLKYRLQFVSIWTVYNFVVW